MLNNLSLLKNVLSVSKKDTNLCHYGTERYIIQEDLTEQIYATFLKRLHHAYSTILPIL